jgi:hypothetical protein
MCKRRIRIVVVAGIGLLSAACAYDNGDNGTVTPMYTSPGTQYVQIPKANIDTGATMADIIPGNGIGLFIEYAAGGKWTVMFTCDTSVNPQPGLTCPWSIDAQTLDGSAISGVDQQGLDGQDYIDHSKPSVLAYDGITTTELDQFSFQAATGSPVGFDIIGLQGVPSPNGFVFWIGDGGLNKGVSALSFDLYPNPAE